MVEKKKAFGGKLMDLKRSGMADMRIGKLFEKDFPKLKIPPTAVVSAFWGALRKLEEKNEECYFGTPEELKGEKKKKSKEKSSNTKSKVKKEDKTKKKKVKK